MKIKKRYEVGSSKNRNNTSSIGETNKEKNANSLENGEQFIST